MGVDAETPVMGNPPSMKISMNILDNDGDVKYTKKWKKLEVFQNILNQFPMELTMNKGLYSENM